MNETTTVARQQLADTLRGIADAFAGLGGVDLTGMYVHLDIQPGSGAAGDEEKVAVIDAVSTAVLGKPAQTERMSGGSYHHSAAGHPPGVYVSIYNSVTNPAERELRAELLRLRAAVGMSGPVVAVAE